MNENLKNRIIISDYVEVPVPQDFPSSEEWGSFYNMNINIEHDMWEY